MKLNKIELLNKISKLSETNNEEANKLLNIFKKHIDIEKDSFYMSEVNIDKEDIDLVNKHFKIIKG